jgi:Tfp pilus assembly protein PilN
MLRINLLPREVLERQRFEGWYRYIFIISVGLILVVLLIAAGLYVAVQQKSDDLQTANEQAQQYAEQGRAFDIFEKKETELAARQILAQLALADRLNIGKLAEEISLVLPDEVWLDSMNIDQANGLTFIGNTPRSTSQAMNVAYKSVAKTLVRLNELPDVDDVWLTSASNQTWSAWDTASTINTTTPVVQFTTSAKVGRGKNSTPTAGGAVAGAASGQGD